MAFSNKYCQVKFNEDKIKFDNFCGKLDFTKAMSQTFGEWLAELRASKGLNQTQLANLSKVTKATISLLESNKIAQPRITSLEKIAKALGITAEEIRQSLAEKMILSEESKLPEPLHIADFNGFDKDDLKEIAEFIAFKKAQKAKTKEQ